MPSLLESPRRAPTLAITLLTAYVLLVHGYHPYAEDGGLYIAGIKKLLDPMLYPAWTAFVTEHLRFSLFAPLVAALVRILHLSLPGVLLGIYLASIWSTLYTAWSIAKQITPGFEARLGAVALLAGAISMPIAGTSLMLFDPYVTARSLSTPLILGAIGYALAFNADARRGRNQILCAACLLAAALVHPLMAAYGLAAVLVVSTLGSERASIRRRGPWLLLVAALAVAGGLQASAPAESANQVWVAMTRYYWFPFRWEWYEQFGLLAPSSRRGGTWDRPLFCSAASRSQSP